MKTTTTQQLENRAWSYSLAAAAAGVGLLALAEPAEAKVIITTNISINVPPDSVVSLSLNNNGIPDFEFSFDSGGSAYSTHVRRQDGNPWFRLAAIPVQGGAVMAGKDGGFASCLARSAKIGPSARWSSQGVLEEGTYYGTSSKSRGHLDGYWGGGQPNRFLGVRFLINGKTHYGWVRLTVKNAYHNISSVTITEYGYESIAGKSLKAGLKGAASLGSLALGAEGLKSWRKEE